MLSTDAGGSLVSIFLNTCIKSLHLDENVMFLNPKSKVWFTVDAVERVAYIGWMTLVLVLLAMFNDIKKNKFRNTLMWAVLGVFFIWMATGPYLQLGALPSQSSPSTLVPGIYLLYSSVPILNLVREPGRFNIIVTLCIAVLSGFGVVELMERNSRLLSLAHRVICRLQSGSEMAIQ